MIIKLQRSNKHSDYLIFENISHINYHAKPVTPPRGEVSHDNGSNEWWYSGTTEALNKISCQRDGKDIDYYFDGEAFICTDEGKTVQKINALASAREPVTGSIVRL